VIGMQVRGEDGSVLAEGGHQLEWESATVAGLDRSQFPMLTGICPYEDTVFNSWQRPMLLAELDRLPPERQGPWAGALRELCCTAEAGLGRYVWFVGD
jgi:hypothetical protein